MEEGTLFHCSTCGSLRVAGAAMRPLNYVIGADGKEHPTVTEEELASIRPLVSDPQHYRCYCFDCLTLSGTIWDGEILCKEKPLHAN